MTSLWLSLAVLCFYQMNQLIDSQFSLKIVFINCLFLKKDSFLKKASYFTLHSFLSRNFWLFWWRIASRKKLRIFFVPGENLLKSIWPFWNFWGRDNFSWYFPFPSLKWIWSFCSSAYRHFAAIEFFGLLRWPVVRSFNC